MHPSRPYDEKVEESKERRVIRVNPAHVVLPGVVDSHVHVNEPVSLQGCPPSHCHTVTLQRARERCHSVVCWWREQGRTEWEGFDSATRAAARGGVTTLADMPLNSIPPTTSVAHLKTKQASAQGKCWIDCKFIGGVVDDNPHELKPVGGGMPCVAMRCNALQCVGCGLVWC